MMGESRRRRLEELLRSQARGQVVRGDQILRARGHSAINRGAAEPAPPLPLGEACGGEAAADRLGRPCWRIRRTLADVEGESAALAVQYARVLRGARQRFDELEATAALCHAADARPEDLLFMDTETCGLAGCMIFLVGMMTFADGQLVFEQWLARDYSEEAAILQAFADRYAKAGVLVTFNGKSFDMTQIRDRWVFHAVESPWMDAPHLDLLHESRRRWKGQLKRFSLQTLERHFCGRHRTGDIPGAAIPAAYHHFVATGDARRMKDILHHNLLDLLTMAQLVTILLTGCDPAE
ncbi:MAG: ribonuclease H-like domain-containing protein [Planctomycetes bacterium]|nr:ribonuclease H-like domain-containing protein [Planctomycetota bacterium]